MDWEKVALLVTAVLGTTGFVGMAKIWLSYRKFQEKSEADIRQLEAAARKADADTHKEREQSVDQRYQRLVDEGHGITKNFADQIVSQLSLISSLNTQVATLAHEGQIARESHARLREQHEALSVRHERERAECDQKINDLTEKLKMATDEVSRLRRLISQQEAPKQGDIQAHGIINFDVASGS